MTTTKIVNGPDKEALFHLLQMGMDAVVEFNIGKPYVIPMHVTGIRREDGSGNCWLIDGWVNDGRFGYSLTIFYNTRTQTGHLKNSDAASIETLYLQGWTWDRSEEEVKAEREVANAVRYEDHNKVCYCDGWETCGA